MKVKLESESPAPWKMKNKKIYAYKFSIDANLKQKQNETVQESIAKAIGKDNLNKYQYSVCAVLDKNNRQYTNTQFQSFDDINIEDAIEKHFEEYSVRGYKPDFNEFYVYVIQNFEKNKGGDGDKNDCLFQAILKAYNFETAIMPKELNKPFKLKKLLGLERNDTVDIKHLTTLEPILNCSFEVSGDACYISEDKKPKNINLNLRNGHYNFLSNGVCLRVNWVKVNNVAEANIYTYKKLDGETTIHNGVETRIISDSEYTNLENGKCLLVNAKNDDLELCRQKYLKKAKYFYEKYGEMINFYKSSYISKLNYKNILLKLQGTQEPDEISNHEAFVIDTAFRGGIRYYEKGTFTNVYDYDINTMYAHYLTLSQFFFPILKPEYLTITNEEFKKWTCFQYGYYLCRPTNSHKFLKLKPEMDWYTHYDLQAFKLLGLDIELSETKNNHLFYSANTRICGRLLKPYVDELYQARMEVDEEYKGDIKMFLSTIYGSMCEKNKRKYFASSKNEIDIGDDFINFIQPSDNGVLLETTSSQKIFKNNYARVSFITAYCRLQILKLIIKYVPNQDDIIMINTDGFATKTKIDNIPIGTKMGEFKVQKYSAFCINHLSDIKKQI